MRVTERVIVPEHEEDKYLHEACDFCGAIIKYEGDRFYGNLSFNKETVEPKSDRVLNFDICEICAHDRIIPFLQSEALKTVLWEDY